MSRSTLNRYYWFCRDHVRAYNAAWDFFDGMDRTEIEAFNREDVTGHRPTWPMGVRGNFRNLWDSSNFSEIFETVFGDSDPGDRVPDGEPDLLADERRAFAVLNLASSATTPEIKCRFKELVKHHHPDLNGGDTANEERLKAIIDAYRVLVRDRRR